MFAGLTIQSATIAINYAQARIDADSVSQIAERLEDKYFQSPAPVRDENGGEVAVFQSHHGYSQIAVASGTAFLAVAFSPDWQAKHEDAVGYLVERSGLLFEAADILCDGKVTFLGVIPVGRRLWSGEDQELINVAARKWGGNPIPSELHDFSVKYSYILEDRYFCNIHIETFRTWRIGIPTLNMLRLARSNAQEKGINFTVDVNTRFSFNEDRELTVTPDLINPLIDHSFRAMTGISESLDGNAS